MDRYQDDDSQIELKEIFKHTYSKMSTQLEKQYHKLKSFL
ncbi:hypothetical protein PSOL_03430 [Candidatus Phytoplasma solani]